MELGLNRTDLDEEKVRLLSGLVSSIKQFRRIENEEDIISTLLFEIYNMKRNNMSKVFSDSSVWINPELSGPLLEKGIIQRIESGDSEKYALTFKGIAQCTREKYGIDLEKQFLRFLELSDQKFTTGDTAELGWRDKLATLSLILMASTSKSSAIRLNNEANKKVLTEVFEKTLSCLKKFGVVENDARLPSTHRGESPVSAIMSRANSLARKTNHYYQNLRDESGYYFDIDKDGIIDQRKLIFLLKRVFEQCDSDRDYGELNRELAEISQLYSPRFLARPTNSTTIFSILKGLKDFIDKEIWRNAKTSQSILQNRMDG